MPGKDVADFFFGEEGFVRLSWDVITHVIGSLMQNSEYIPYHEEEDAIGDFNIPDEIEDMQLGSRKDHEDGQLSLFELYPILTRMTEKGATRYCRKKQSRRK